MGVYIKGMEMPESCFMCELMQLSGGGVYMKCPLVKFKCSSDDFYGYFAEHRQAECPLVPVPEPHGRLIDAEELKETLDYYICEAGWSDEINKALNWVKDEFINSEPTIIPASEEE